MLYRTPIRDRSSKSHPPAVAPPHLSVLLSMNGCWSRPAEIRLHGVGMSGSHPEQQGRASDTLALHQVAGAASPRWPLRVHPWARQGLSLAVVVLTLALAWEGVKFLGGDPWTFSTNEGALVSFHFKPPLSLAFASDLNMPHVWDIGAA